MDTGIPFEKATFAAGCFWGVEAAFRRLEGVVETQVGYSGGETPEPTYEQVCSGNTGHTEAVEVLFDSRIISYMDLLSVFWEIHDPTQKDRQGPDIGTNYRSVIFFHTPEQRRLAETSKQKLAQLPKYQDRQIVTEILPATHFWKAEEYHQQFYEKCGRGYCASQKNWE